MTTRHRSASIVCALVALAGTLLVAAPAPGVGSTADRPRTGFEMRSDGTAAGGWLGSRTASRRVVFRIDPEAKPKTSGFRNGRWVRELRGSGPVDVDRWRVRRAAWLVSKYGTYDSEAQAAAVELALDALLHGGAHRLTGAATRARLRQSGSADSILQLARYMLDASTEMAGPYRVRLDTTGTVIGGQAEIRVSVKVQRTGEPVPRLPVTVRYDDRKLSGETDAAGRVVVNPDAPMAGPRQVTVTIGRVPSDRLFVRSPASRGASRVVVAGRKIQLLQRTVVPVQAQPQVSVSAPDVHALTGPVPGSVHLTGGYPTGRAAELTLHGPFALDEAATCEPARGTDAGTVIVAADGSYPVPEIKVSEAGVYRWSVSVPADDYNLAASACGEQVTLKAVPGLSVTPVVTPVRRGGDAVAKVKAKGLPAGFARDAIVRLYGPFTGAAGVRCTTAKQVRWRAAPVTGPSDTVRTAPVSLGTAGLYAWRVVLPATDLTLKSRSPCGAAGSLLRVR